MPCESVDRYVGNVYGSWTVVEYLGRRGSFNRPTWKVVCKNGHERHPDKYVIDGMLKGQCSECPRLAFFCEGHRFGTRTVTSEPIKAGKFWQYECVCDCGAVSKIYDSHIRSGMCRKCRSCASRRHGLTRTPEYRAWSHMIGRCNTKTDAAYDRYGGRGIRVCERWMSFEAFLNDMGRRPSRIHTIDRIDNDGDYAPENCRWATPTQQARNRRSTVHITCNGESKTAAEWAELIPIKASTISARIRKGWDENAAIMTPVINGIKHASAQL